MDEVTVRRVERADMKAVIDMLKENMSPFAPPEEEYDAIWEAYTAQENMHGVVAVIDGVVVGYAAMLVEIKMRGGRVGHMEDIVTSSAYRRRGIGSKIMNELREMAKAIPCYKVSVTIQEHNVPFYKTIGYDVDGLSIGQHLNK